VEKKRADFGDVSGPVGLKGGRLCQAICQLNTPHEEDVENKVVEKGRGRLFTPA